MGAKMKDFSYGSSSDPLAIFLYIILAIIAVYSLYKFYLYYMDQRKWSWFTGMCSEKKMSSKEATYLKNVVMRKKIGSVDELYGSIYSLNLPSPIKRKLLWDEAPPAAQARPPSRTAPRGTTRTHR